MARHSRPSSETGAYLKVAALVAVIVLLLILGIWSVGQSPDGGR